MKGMQSLIHAFFHSKVVPVVLRFSQNKYLRALRYGFGYIMPFLIVGSFLLLFLNLPLVDPKGVWYSESYANFVLTYKEGLMHLFRISMGAMALFVSFGIGYALSKDYKLSGISGGFLSLYAFLILSAQTALITLGGEKDFYGVCVDSLPILDARFLDAKGLFSAFFIRFFSC